MRFPTGSDPILHRRDYVGGRLSVRNAALRPRSSPSTTIEQAGRSPRRSHRPWLGLGACPERLNIKVIRSASGRLSMRLRSTAGIGEPLSGPRRGSWPRAVPMTSLGARGVARSAGQKLASGGASGGERTKLTGDGHRAVAFHMWPGSRSIRCGGDGCPARS